MCDVFHRMMVYIYIFKYIQVGQLIIAYMYFLKVILITSSPFI